MTSIDIDHLRTWIGKPRSDEDLVSARHARLMTATVDYYAADRIRDGERLPPLWHWIYFLEARPGGELGRDGHPARGGFLPPVPLPNRMWAGGRVAFIAPPRIGSNVRKESSVLKVEHKRGRSGDLVFVTVLHQLYSPLGDQLIREEHDIVYRDAARAGVAGDAPPPLPPAQFTRVVTPDSTMLFRYSALTFNGHRIHYDADYCRDVEGYANLVVHGPLIATLLAGYAEEISGKHVLEFGYRALTPALLGGSITLRANVLDDRVFLHAALGDGTACMQAQALIG